MAEARQPKGMTMNGYLVISQDGIPLRLVSLEETERSAEIKTAVRPSAHFEREQPGQYDIGQDSLSEAAD